MQDCGAAAVGADPTGICERRWDGIRRPGNVRSRAHEYPCAHRFRTQRLAATDCL